MKKKISTIIADDHCFIRQSLSELIHEHYDAEVSLAMTSEETISLLETQRANLLILDFPMPHADAFKVIEYVQRRRLDTRIIVLTAFFQEATIFNLLRLNVHGILFKKLVDHHEICRAISAVLDHKYYFHEKVRLALQARPNAIQSPPKMSLSEREYQIIEMLSNGKPTKQIADLLSLSEYTIEDYRKGLLRKTQTRNTTELIAFSLRNGIISYT